MQGADSKRVPAFVHLPLLWTSLAFLLGILAANRWPHGAAWPWLAALCLLALLAALWRWPHAAARLALFAALLLTLGALRYQAAQPQLTPADLAFYNNAEGQLQVWGHLTQPAVARENHTELWFEAEQLELDGQLYAVRGRALARVALGQQWHYGDGVLLTGRLRTPGGDEDDTYAEYLARQGVHSEMPFANVQASGQWHGDRLRQWLYSIRSAGVERLHQLYPDPVAGLLAGILLGDESGISQQLKQAFNTTGTRHIVAISGFNISIIAGLALSVFTRVVGKRRGLWLAGLCIVAYTVLVGAQASVVRAAIMGLVVLAAQLAGRDQHSLNTLAFTAALMALVNPLILWDVGFQLSFMATLGLLVYAGPWQAWLEQQLEARLPAVWATRLAGPISEYFLFTLAAQVLTLPLLLYHFGQFSLITFPANLLILPLQPALFILGGLSLLVSWVWFLPGQLLALCAWPLGALTVRSAQWLAQPAWAVYPVEDVSLALVLLYYAAVLAASLAPLRQALRRWQPRPALVAGLLAGAALAAWGLAAAAPSGRLQVTLLDVPGEAILIRTPTGRNVLINGGGSALELSSQLGHHLPFFARQLDWVLLGGSRAEQIDGLRSGFERLQANGVLWAHSWPTPQLSALLENLSTYAPSALAQGQALDLGDEASLQVLGIGPRGATFLLQWRNFQALLPTGIDVDQLSRLRAEPVAGLDLLLLPEGGYPPLNPPEWLAGSGARVYWLSAEGTAPRAALPGRLLSVAEHGWLRAETDGYRLWLSSATP